MNIMPKIFSVVAVGSLALLLGCNHKRQAASKTVSASVDTNGSHPTTAAVDGPVEVTCVSATDDSGNPTPPACVVTGPGTDGVVDIGHKVTIAGAGNVVLTCRGKGTLACTARIDE
jgi:hypothetical protein